MGRVGQKGKLMETDLLKILEDIKKSAELVFEHYQSRGFKNTLIEVGLKNIISMAKDGMKQMESPKRSE